MAPVSRSVRGSVSSKASKAASSRIKMRVSQSSVMRQHIDTIRKLEAALALPPLLDADARVALRATATRVPPAFLEAAAAAAEDNAGNLGGVTLDADEVRSTLAYLAASEALLGAIDLLARSLRDDMLAKRARLVERAMAGYRSMSSTKRLPEGEAHRGALVTLRSALRGRKLRPKDVVREKPPARPQHDVAPVVVAPVVDP